jgi:hypothetical protein
VPECCTALRCPMQRAKAGRASHTRPSRDSVPARPPAHVYLQSFMDLYNYLLRQRIVFLSGYVNDKVSGAGRQPGLQHMGPLSSPGGSAATSRRRRGRCRRRLGGEARRRWRGEQARRWQWWQRRRRPRPEAQLPEGRGCPAPRLHASDCRSFSPPPPPALPRPPRPAAALAAHPQTPSSPPRSWAACWHLRQWMRTRRSGCT